VQHASCTLAYRAGKSKVVSGLHYLENGNEDDGRDEPALAETARRFVERQDCVKQLIDSRRRKEADWNKLMNQ